jgi:DNA ligase 1
MKRFAQLFNELDRSTATLDKVAALKRYFANASAADAAWATYFLAGGKPRQVVKTAELRALARESAGVPEWLFDECYQAVGDLAETIALVLPPTSSAEPYPHPPLGHPPLEGEGNATVGLATWIENRLLPLRTMEANERAEKVRAYWNELDTTGRFLLTKLIGGGFRVGVSKLLVQRALAEHAGIDAKRVAERMMGFTDGTRSPTAEAFLRIIRDVASNEAASANDDETAHEVNGQPYPFFLAHQIPFTVEEFDAKLGAPSNWIIEWKYDGIRAQVVKRGGMVFIWSRGEELMTDRFPEIVEMANALDDGTVLDGEILAWRDDRPLPFAVLQQRIGRKTISKKVLADAPVIFMAYDVLEMGGRDQRMIAQYNRAKALEKIYSRNIVNLSLSPNLIGRSWRELASLREESRGRGVEGFMLKQRDAAYGSGRTKADGTWWKWKIDPMTIDCVLIYAQAGHGRRASLYTDYTFAVWSRAPRDASEAAQVIEDIASGKPAPSGALDETLQLVPFAKAYSGLTDEEFKRIDAVIRKTTINKFGPVRSVKPTLVFELGFEGINESTRHKSGIAVRFPRMLRIRDDKPIHEANALAELRVLLNT